MDGGPRVYGLGQCALDHLGRIPEYPPPDVKCEFTGLVVQGGGPVATALVALSRWGISTRFAGVIGSDSFGSDIRKSLETEGVNTDGLLVREGYESQFAFILAEPGEGRRTIFWQRPTGPPPDPHEIDLASIREAALVHTDGIFAEASLAACNEATKSGRLVSVDAGSVREGMLDLARLSDFYIASEVFARTFLGRDDPDLAVRELAGLGPALACVTLGPRGYIALYEGETIEGRAHPVDAVDTTGCGDLFHGGFLFGILKGWGVKKSLDFGAWSASRVALKLGGRAGIPRWEEYPGL
ncbi:MAG: carbohydrate kinase family protein [Planctomycetota bacterium]